VHSHPLHAPTEFHFDAAYSALHRLSDGRKVRLRLLRPDDRGWLLVGFEQLSPESRYRRFFTAMPRLRARMVEQLLDVDGWRHLAIAAETVDDGAPLGVARFIRRGAAGATADAAVTVVDRVHRRGLGRLLLSTLAAAARERGIISFRVEVLRTNAAINAMVREFAEPAPPRFESSVAVYEVPLPETTSDPAAIAPLSRLLRLATGGIDVLLRRLAPY
jgi:GNAT superfamily N-acetyltransferase